jgi:branched-chain amino acid transport system ATP-binding protein
MTALLELRHVGKRFGGLQALDDVSFSVPEGGVFGIMGANGAGKTTLFNIVAGALKPNQGQILLRGGDVTGWEPSRLCVAGIARTFQIARPFPALTAFETVRAGTLNRERRMAAAGARAEAVLERFGLTPKAEVLGRDLTILERKRLELARAYATRPTVLLLDEVAAGLRPNEVEILVALVREIAAEGITVLMIEHVLAAIFSLAARTAVLDYGRLIAQGTPQEVAKDPRVVAAYFGAGHAAA